MAIVRKGGSYEPPEPPLATPLLYITTLCIAVRTIVHPGIDVHFDIAFLNDHCGKVYHGSDFKLFGNVENEYGFIFNGFVSMETLLTFDI